MKESEKLSTHLFFRYLIKQKALIRNNNDNKKNYLKNEVLN